MFKEMENKILLHFFERPVDCFSGETLSACTLFIKPLYDIHRKKKIKPVNFQIRRQEYNQISAFSLAPSHSE